MSDAGRARHDHMRWPAAACGAAVSWPGLLSHVCAARAPPAWAAARRHRGPGRGLSASRAGGPTHPGRLGRRRGVACVRLTALRALRCARGCLVSACRRLCVCACPPRALRVRAARRATAGCGRSNGRLQHGERQQHAPGGGLHVDGAGALAAASGRTAARARVPRPLRAGAWAHARACALLCSWRCAGPLACSIPCGSTARSSGSGTR